MIRKQICLLTLLGAVLLGLGSCTAPKPMEQMTVDIRGQIVEVHTADAQSSNNGTLLGAVRIEGVIEEDTRFDHAAVTITNETRIFAQRGQERQPITFADVANGQQAEVQFAGSVMETYPVQGTAAVLVILQEQE